VSLTGKVAVVTGSTRGIGRAIAEALVMEEVSVVISSRRQSDVEKTVKSLSQRGKGKVAGIACDVRDHGQVKALVEFAVTTFGGLDILVNNAGVAIFGEVANLKPEEWREVIDTNLTGVFSCCHEAIPKMRSRGGGYIINIGSLAGANAHPKMAAYNASKFGLLGFSEALFQEVRYDGIRVSHIMPGSVETEFRGAKKEKVGWAILPEHIAEMVVYLLKSPPRTMTSRIEMRPSQPRKG
jgi:NAD(P)-dependent dehydrogenase (short-subunit alcohol dehydrogenase family)